MPASKRSWIVKSCDALRLVAITLIASFAGAAFAGLLGGLAAIHHSPTFGIELHGSAGARASPRWSSSTEIRSGERTNAMRPSRGGRQTT